MVTLGAVSALKDEAARVIEQAADATAIANLRVRFLGKKGELTSLMKELGAADAAERKALGAALNAAKQAVEELLTARETTLKSAELETRLSAEKIDLTLPVAAPLNITTPGSLHPLSVVQRELEDVFRGLGFTVVDGPEVDREYYNFEALNIPATHPARDMQDTFWTAGGDVVRTHTSSMQVRALERMKPPLRVVAPGRCFRYERSDASHEHTFYQMEGMMVDRHISIGHLVYFMRTLLRELLGFEPKIRLRPGYFPFVEPGFELDIWFKGRWLELIGCGLVHPRVIRYGGLDPEIWQGFAFGFGLSRIVMFRHEIDDIRHLLGGDLRFIRQFS